MIDFDFTPFVHLVHFLGGYMDAHTEVVLFSLDDIDHSVIAIHNGHISGRKLGDPLSNFIISKLKDKGKDTPPYYLDHISLSKDGINLRSGSYIILDKSGNPRGVLMLSTDVSQYKKAAELLQQLSFLPSFEVSSTESPELDILQTTPKDMILHIIHKVTGTTRIDTARLTTDEKIEVVRNLNAENFFLMKGAVSQVASIIDASEATVYRYLSKINKPQ